MPSARSGRERPRVDFYVIEDAQADARAHTACRLAERAWRVGHRVLVLVPSAADAEHLDELLWTYRQDSFVPHAALPPSGAVADRDLRETPVWIGSGPVPDAMNDVLINLTDDVPLTYTRFARIAEVVDGTGGSRAAGRERFRYYRDHDCEVHTHNL